MPVPADEEMSVWRSLLHNDDGYSEAENDVSVRYGISPTCCRQAGQNHQSLGEVPDDDDGIMSIMISSDADWPVGGEVGGVCGEMGVVYSGVGGACSGGGTSCEFPGRHRRRLFRSDSSLVASVASDATALASRKIQRSSSVPCVNTTSLPNLLEEAEGDCKGCGTGIGRSPSWPAEDMSATVTPMSVLTNRHLEPSGSSSSRVEETVDLVVSDSDIAVTIESELPGDAMETSSLDSRLPIPTEDAERPRPESGNPHVSHPPGVTCMDHQVCSLLADFVAHL